MIDPDLSKQLSEINSNLVAIKAKKGPGAFRAFFNGTMSGLGSIVGAAIALAILAWFLNRIGVIPAFRSEVDKLNQALDFLGKNK